MCGIYGENQYDNFMYSSWHEERYKNGRKMQISVPYSLILYYLLIVKLSDYVRNFNAEVGLHLLFYIIKKIIT